MQSMSQFEKEALRRLSEISQPTYDKFQQIFINNPTHRITLEKIFKTAQTTVAQVQLQIRIKDLPKTPEQLALDSERQSMDIHKLLNNVLAPQISDLIRQVKNQE